MGEEIRVIDNVDIARARAARIRETTPIVERWMRDVIDADRDRDWKTLGYPSWEEYVTAEFGTLPRLGREGRNLAIGNMADAGMTRKKVAAALGVGTTTVDRALRRSAPNGAPPTPPGPSARPGRNEWARKVETVSATVPMKSLTADEIREIRGAAIYLRDLCTGALVLRKEE